MAFWKRNKEEAVPLVEFDPAVKAEVVEAELVEPTKVAEEVKPVSRNSDRTAIIVLGSMAFLLLVVLVVGVLLVANNVSKAAAPETLAPAAIESVAPAPAASVEKPAAVVEQPKAEPIAPVVVAPIAPVSEPVVFSNDPYQRYSLIADNAEVISGWDSRDVALPQVAGFVNLSDWGYDPEEFGTSGLFVISSDSGDLALKDSAGVVLATFDSGKFGFVAIVEIKEGQTLEILNVGYNEENQHKNTSLYARVIPVATGDTVAQAAKSLAERRQQEEHKPWLITIVDAKVETLKAATQ